MSFIGEEGGKGGRSSRGREEEVRKRLEEGRRANDDGRKADEDGRRASGDMRRANDEKPRAEKGGGKSNGSGRSQVSNELMGKHEQKTGRQKREVTPRKEDSCTTGGEEQLRRVPYLQV